VFFVKLGNVSPREKENGRVSLNREGIKFKKTKKTKRDTNLNEGKQKGAVIGQDEGEEYRSLNACV